MPLNFIKFHLKLNDINSSRTFYFSNSELYKKLIIFIKPRTLATCLDTIEKMEIWKYWKFDILSNFRYFLTNCAMPTPRYSDKTLRPPKPVADDAISIKKYRTFAPFYRIFEKKYGTHYNKYRTKRGSFTRNVSRHEKMEIWKYWKFDIFYQIFVIF